MILINLQKLEFIHSNTSVLLDLNRELLPMLELILEPMWVGFLNCRPGPCNCAQMSSSSCQMSSSSENSCQISLFSDSSCRMSSSRSDGTSAASVVTPLPLLLLDHEEEEDTFVSMWPLERLRRWPLAVQCERLRRWPLAVQGERLRRWPLAVDHWQYRANGFAVEH